MSSTRFAEPRLRICSFRGSREHSQWRVPPPKPINGKSIRFEKQLAFPANLVDDRQDLVIMPKWKRQ
jgi:hypothetical protein